SNRNFDTGVRDGRFVCLH
ncbi:hypothetical protein AVEN_191737-1, partial [Araneus ventricosus]